MLPGLKRDEKLNFFCDKVNRRVVDLQPGECEVVGSKSFYSLVCINFLSLGLNCMLPNKSEAT